MTSEGDTSTYNLITWVELHTAYGRTKRYDPWPTFPLTPTKIHGVGALLKGAAYRSPKNYLQVAKRHHILAGYPWSDQLKLAADQFRASTMRGMGPPRQSGPIDYITAAMTDYGEDPVIKNGPIGTNNLIVIGVMFLLRELELATARRANCRINNKTKTVTMRLTASKRDPEAIGIERTWGCVCDKNTPANICPFHAAMKQQEILNQRFGVIGPEDDIPLFPRLDGKCVEGDVMVQLVELIASRQGQALKTADGVTRFGGHSWRATGAVYLSSIGINMHKIALLARWASAVITHYTRIAPLRSLTEDFKRRQERHTPKAEDISPARLIAIEDELKVAMNTELENRMNTILNETKSNEIKVRKIMDKCFEAHVELQNKINKFIEKNSHQNFDKPLCTNTRTKVTHKILTTIQSAGNEARTWCMWKYAKGFARLAEELGTTGDTPCKECFPEFRKS